jgi:phospholipase/carboxylesterase
VVPVQAMLMAVTMLGAAGRSVQWHMARGIAHGVDPDTMALSGQFLALAAGGHLAAKGPVSCAFPKLP